MNTLFQTIYNFLTMNSNIIFYLVPCLTCLSVYTHRTVLNYFKDLKKRSDKYYTPTDTVGDVVGRFLIAIIPFINIVAFLFECGPYIIIRIYLRFETLLNTPLVSEKKLNISIISEKSNAPIDTPK